MDTNEFDISLFVLLVDNFLRSDSTRLHITCHQNPINQRKNLRSDIIPVKNILANKSFTKIKVMEDSCTFT